MVAAMIIAGRLIWQGERRVFSCGWVTNHEYPVLITRLTVFRVGVFRDIVRRKVLTWQWGVDCLVIQCFGQLI